MKQIKINFIFIYPVQLQCMEASMYVVYMSITSSGLRAGCRARFSPFLRSERSIEDRSNVPVFPGRLYRALHVFYRPQSKEQRAGGPYKLPERVSHVRRLQVSIFLRVSFFTI